MSSLSALTTLNLTSSHPKSWLPSGREGVELKFRIPALFKQQGPSRGGSVRVSCWLMDCVWVACGPRLRWPLPPSSQGWVGFRSP